MRSVRGGSEPELASETPKERSIAKRLRPAGIRERIRKAACGEDIYALLLEES